MIEDRMKKITEWLGKEYQSIRTGQATPALLDSVKVESYGTVVPLQQVANVGVENARTLRIAPWDPSTVKSIEKAITEADLGLSVSVDDSGLRAIFPELTGERRTQLLKLAKQKLEEARVSVRAARDEAMKDIETKEKNSEIGEDEKFAKKEQIQKSVDTTNQELETIYQKKNAEIST